MFARTERLLLRPGFAEDAPALARAIGDQMIVRNLATAPWPYGEAEAQAFLSRPHDPALPHMLIVERNGSDTPTLVGACSLQRKPSGAIEMGYWIARAHWGRGLATEAGQALVEIARALRLPRIEAAHFVDNPASGRVLEKLGFSDTAICEPHYSCARGGEAMTRLYRLELAAAKEAMAA